MYDDGVLSWGDTQPEQYGFPYYGNWENPGQITMNFTAYFGPGAIGGLDMLVLDLVHESAHSLNDEPDGPVVPGPDQWGRENLNSVSWDGLYAGGQCPIPDTPPQ